jgi:protein lifeguard
MFSGALFVVLIVVICFGILCAFVRSYYLRMIYASLGAIVFSLYLVFDTQLMMGGKHKYAISPEEYIFAALNLYLDIVNMFLFLLQLIGGRRG